VLGALAIGIAIVRIILGLQLIGLELFGDIDYPGSGAVWTGILTLIVGLIYLGVGWALWSMRPWALVFTMIMAVFGLVDAMFVWIATGQFTYGLAAAAIPALLLWYTSRQDIRDEFAAADMAQYATNPQATGDKDTEGPPPTS